ncbi:hypothetical protein Godav_027985 [Gossypium davidsonii]|uniref:Uncharacterized protein n=1 Tax=Gossypium davidsonii TaxID=34287 RepID=A0A7J8RXY6_GOSDV|nr:hypothetical protein [Gossypium davidsonii]
MAPPPITACLNFIFLTFCNKIHGETTTNGGIEDETIFGHDGGVDGHVGGPICCGS